jgi:TolA-binding protein
MMIVEALTLLGLSWSDKDCTQAITRAWKLKLLCAHPDKNSSCDAVQQTQRLNQAKEVLLANLKEPVGTSTILEQLKKQQEDMNRVIERMKQEMQERQIRQQQEMQERQIRQAKKRDRQFVEVAKKGREAVLEQRARSRKRRAEG